MEAVVSKRKPLSIDEMEPIAKDATRSALSGYEAPSEEVQATWRLGKIETENEGIFEIYIPAERPKEATVVSRARVDRWTGAVRVEVYLESR